MEQFQNFITKYVVVLAMVDITFLGCAGFSIQTENSGVLIDPYIEFDAESSPYAHGDTHCPFTIPEVMNMADYEAILVSHLGFDHYGNTPEIIDEYDVPVLTDWATAVYLYNQGIPNEMMSMTGWGGGPLYFEDYSVRVLKAHHHSISLVEGNLVTGVPLSFLIEIGNTSIYHMGDTTISKEFELIGDFYDPDIVLMPVGGAMTGRKEGMTAFADNRDSMMQLSTDEAVMTAKMLDCEKIIPMHYQEDEKSAFMEAMNDHSETPKVIDMNPGDTWTEKISKITK